MDREGRALTIRSAPGPGIRDPGTRDLGPGDRGTAVGDREVQGSAFTAVGG
jgi:hypothetical protein